MRTRVHCPRHPITDLRLVVAHPRCFLRGGVKGSIICAAQGLARRQKQAKDLVEAETVQKVPFLSHPAYSTTNVSAGLARIFLLATLRESEHSCETAGSICRWHPLFVHHSRVVFLSTRAHICDVLKLCMRWDMPLELCRNVRTSCCSVTCPIDGRACNAGTPVYATDAVATYHFVGCVRCTAEGRHRGGRFCKADKHLSGQM